MNYYNHKNTPIMCVRSTKAAPVYRIAFLWCIFLLPYHYAIGQDQICLNLNAPQPRLEEVVKGYHKKADSLIGVGKHKEGEVLYELAFRKVKNEKNDSLLITIGNAYTDVLYNFTKMSRAIELNEMIIELCKKHTHNSGLINAYLIKGRIMEFHKRKKFEAFEIFSKAIHLLDTTTPNDIIANCYYERGYLLLEIGQNQAARKDFQHAISNIVDKNSDQIAYSYEGIRNTFSNNELDSINQYQNLVINCCKKRDFGGNFCLEAYIKLAQITLLKNDPKKAQAILNEHIDENKINANFNDAIYYEFMETKAGIHMALGEYNAAIEKLTIVKNYVLERKELNSSLVILEKLSKAYEKNGDLKSSIATTRMIKPLMDTMGLQRIRREVAKLEIQSKLVKKEKEISTLKEQKETITLLMSKFQLTSYALSALLLLGIFVFINRISVNKAKFYKLNEKVNHNRLLSLQSAMNPHFLFNTFGTLQHFILKKEIKKANSYMTTLSDLIRNVFASSNSIYIRFNSEILILKSYVELELDRFDHNFEVLYDIPKELTNNNPMIPSMILQPYVENAIIHGFSEKKGDKNLALRFIPNSSKSILCEIMDNGVGRQKVEEIQKNSKAKGRKNLSIATKNTQERLRIINKKDDEEGSIVIQDLYDSHGIAIGTKVMITLPIIESDN